MTSRKKAKKGNGKMKAILDKDGCIGCGLCANTCPDVFSLMDDGIAAVTGEVKPENVDLANEAAEGCPVSVITIED